jgi:hypothetical protein
MQGVEVDLIERAGFHGDETPKIENNLRMKACERGLSAGYNRAITTMRLSLN